MAKKTILKDRETNNQIYPTTSLDCVLDFPLNGKKGQVLMHNGTKAEWSDFPLLDLVTYGVLWKTDVADPNLIRVGNPNYHRTLPIQSNMKGCIYNSLERKIVYWLDEDDWKYKKGGNPNKGEVEQLSRLDGYDGEVMVYVPEFWIRSWDESDYKEVRVSTVYIDDTWEYLPAVVIGAYRDTILNTVPENMGYLSTLQVNSAISVANDSAYCRGGSNRAEYDTYEDVFRRDLGKPRTNISRPTMRTYVRKCNKEILSYRLYKNIFYWLWVIEYATFNSQAPFNANLDSQGYHQGGMGMGITTLNWNFWGWYNYYNSLALCGYTNELGNKSGIKNMTITFPTAEDGYTTENHTFGVPRWRGFENPFGDIWTNLEGIVIEQTEGLSNVYTTNDPNKFDDTIEGKLLSGHEYAVSDGHIKEFNLGETSEIIPISHLDTSTKYKCDYHYRDITSRLRTLIVGGGADLGSGAGLSYFNSRYDVSNSDVNFSFRSTSFPNNIN